MRVALALAFFTLIANLTIRFSFCQVIKQGCLDKCGNVTIPYPFGTKKSCALEEKFIIYCDKTYLPPKPFLSSLNHSLEVLDISLEGYLRKNTYVARDCYDPTGQTRHFNSTSSKLGDFFFSSTRNNFTVLGCDTRGIIGGTTQGVTYYSGCLSYCRNQSIVVNGSCSGIGCCQTSIPPRLSNYSVSLFSYRNHTLVYGFNPCSYAFIADKNYFNFTIATLKDMPKVVPTVIDWAIGNQSCAEALENRSSYACQENSECRDSDNGPGYHCFCSPGYTGSPYVHNGCVDVDQCKDPSLHECSHKCHNVQGNYTCSCPKWYHGDGRKSGQGCTLNKHSLIVVLVGDGILLLLIAVGSLTLYNEKRKRMEAKLKEKFFKQNGGLILLDRISRNEVNSINNIKIFKLEELKEATDNFSEGKICGTGGFGTVYKGCLSNGCIVAIKKSKITDHDQVEQFINEITILSQINHRNVVRFLGCCLEIDVPLLVYEFISNGTLSDHIHDRHRPKMPWQTRLKIAAETAGVLAYLHTDHSSQIIHRDIKPSNVLLNEDYTSKVSDFGASRLNPKDEIEMCTLVRGTLGYLDPEYLQTSQLTEKSDVYSFGVVLVELLTGLKVVSFERSEDERSLVLYFLSLTKDDQILEILDKAIMNNDYIEEIKQVLKIAKMCVSVKSEERPTMKEVAMELEGLLKESKHQWVEGIFEVEREHLLGQVSNNNHENSIQMTEYSGRPDYLLRINDGR